MGRREIADSRPRPKVSVAIVTYNHRAFIAEAVESALRQEAPFDLEIVIGDDHSTDGTREILESYARRDPRVRLLLHPHRLGPDEPYLGGKNNFLTTYAACRGEYIAFLDGDDYWTDTTKLLKQVALLDAHPDYAFCCHPVAVEYHDDRARHWPAIAGRSPRSVWTLEDILRLETKPEMPLLSMMMRSDLLRAFPPWFEGVANGDYALQVLLARHGEIFQMPDCMAVHRKHRGGRSRIYDEDADLANRMLLKLHIALNEELGFRFRHILDPYIERESQSAAAADLDDALRDASPSSVVALALAEFAAQTGAGVTVQDGVTVVTPSDAWAYAAWLAVPSPGRGGRHAAVIRMRLRVDGAEAGIGVLDAAGERFLDRACVGPSPEPVGVRLRIADVADASALVVQSWSAPQSATVHIDSAELLLYSRDPLASGSSIAPSR